MAKTLPISKVKTHLRETLDVLSDPGLMRQIRKSLAYFGRGGKGKRFEDVFGEPLGPAKR